MARNIFTSAVAFTLALTAAPAIAQQADWTGFYAGGSLGYADISEDDSSVFDDDGLTYGLHAGYNYDIGSYVFGGEIEVSGFDASNNNVDVDTVTRFKVRAGYDAGDFLPYVTAGFASLDTGGAFGGSDDGSVYGIGVDYQFNDDWRFGTEVLQHDFDDFNGTGFDFEATTITARVSYTF